MKFLGHHMDPAFLVVLAFVVLGWIGIMRRLTLIANLLIRLIRETRRP